MQPNTQNDTNTSPPSSTRKKREVDAQTSCRKRKTKCTREQPCSQCSRMNLECHYDDSRERSGVKTGAIESLNQRLSMLEHMFLGQGILFERLLVSTSSTGHDSSSDSLQDRATPSHSGVPSANTNTNHVMILGDFFLVITSLQLSHRVSQRWPPDLSRSVAATNRRT